jgi:hypothetical protein
MRIPPEITSRRTREVLEEIFYHIEPDKAYSVEDLETLTGYSCDLIKRSIKETIPFNIFETKIESIKKLYTWKS